jgi:adenylate cyclase
MMELGGDGNVMASSATLSALQPGTIEELGISVKPWRRAFFAPAPSGVPSDLGIWRLRLRRP